jgi:hypothetical protein
MVELFSLLLFGAVLLAVVILIDRHNGISRF